MTRGITAVLALAALAAFTSGPLGAHATKRPSHHHQVPHRSRHDGQVASPPADAPAQTPDAFANCTAFGAFAAMTPELSTLAGGVFLTQEAADTFNETVAAGTRVTTFAATNEAYAEVGNAMLDALAADADIAAEVCHRELHRVSLVRSGV